MQRTREEIEKRLAEIDTLITESDISKKSYDNEKVMLINELQDIDKPVIDDNILDQIYEAIQRHVEDLDYIDPSDCEFDFGIDYDCRITVESMQVLRSNDHFAEALYNSLKTLFKVTKKEDEDSV